MTMQDLITTPRLPPPPSFLYPSPGSQVLPSPYHTHSHSHPHPHPGFARSESTPQISARMPQPQRPQVARTSTSPLNPKNDFTIAGAVGGVRNGQKTDEEEREELTTKGRKRKRLAKACSACHKNKRRCDGFAPCSNCEFSSRPCLYVNAQGEIIPPPRTRESTSAPKKESDGPNESDPTATPGKPEGSEKAKEGASPAKSNGEKEKQGFTDPLEAVDRDPSLSAELIDIFFNRIQPYATMFHGPTFFYRLYQGRVSPLLLDSVYALAAHLCNNQTLLGTLSPSVPAWARGEAFAERARLGAQRLVEVRGSWSDEDRRMDRGTWEETEFVQALYLLSLYYSCLRQSSTGFFLLDIAIDIMRPTSTATLPPPAQHLALSAADYLTLMEARNRTFWMLVLCDLCAAANGRQRRLMDHEMYNVPLPGEEAQWDRWGGGGSTGREGGRRDGLAVGTGNWYGDEGSVGELGHVLRILAIFSDIMTVANNGGTGSETRGTPVQHEQALKSWALSLPHHLRFDETSLATAAVKINNPLHTTARSGWLFAYMHAVAECGMFYLQAALASNGAHWTAQRQSQAVDNIAVIMEAVGVKGRESPLMLFPLLVVSNWYDHLRSSASSSTKQELLLEGRLDLWWAESVQDWGFERNATMDRGLYPDNTRHVVSPLIMPRAPTTALGLYSTTSPPNRALDSAVSISSASSSAAVVTPGSSHPYRYSTSSTQSHQLAPLRPRAQTLTFPPVTSSPPRNRPHLPSMSALSEPRNEIKLPPLPSLDPSPGPGMQNFKFPSFWDTKTSPRFQPYEKKRPVSPLSRDRWGKGDDEYSSITSRGPVGIAALVSAAEEKSRERESQSVKAIS